MKTMDTATSTKLKILSITLSLLLTVLSFFFCVVPTACLIIGIQGFVNDNKLYMYAMAGTALYIPVLLCTLCWLTLSGFIIFHYILNYMKVKRKRGRRLGHK